MKLSFHLAALVILTSGLLHWIFQKNTPVSTTDILFTAFMSSLAFLSARPKRAQ